MMDSDQKRAFIAVVISGVILLAWQFYFAPADLKVSPRGASSPLQTSLESKPVTQPAVVPSVANPELVRPFSLTNNQVTYNLDASLAVVNIQQKSKSTFGTFHSFIKDDLVGGKHPLTWEILDGDGQSLGAPILSFQDQADSKVIGTENKSGAKAEISFIDHDQLSVKFSGSKPFRIQWTIASHPYKHESKLREFVLLGNSSQRFSVGADEKGEGTYKWIGVDFNYHLFAITFAGQTVPIKYFSNSAGELIAQTLIPQNDFTLHLVYTKKEYDGLVAMGDGLQGSIDFGIFGILAVPILRGLQFFYNFIPNYGVSIIFLTLVLRLITFPLQHKSYKSMKKMQEIQPELAKIKEKYKDEPQKMQAESMELFKRSGASPFSGCLPMLLQLPIFFAFYKVLYSAVELVDAPFVGWVVDLSEKDPYYVLPVLMTIAMYIQQKMTPNTSMDKMQQRILSLMPLVFGFIMKDLPSGLALYIFVSTIFGIIQQLFVYQKVK